jgi:prevent-host-death family protein
MSDLEIPIRELHARTGHYVRKASERGRILVTHRGKPMAELRPLAKASSDTTTWKDREILPAFAAIMDQPVGGTESGAAITDDRERA